MQKLFLFISLLFEGRKKISLLKNPVKYMNRLVINRQYVLKAVSRLGITILPISVMITMAETSPELKKCTIVPFIGNATSSNLDDKNNLKTFNTIFEVLCNKQVYLAEHVSTLERAEMALWLISLYYHYRAVAKPEVVYQLLSFCLKENILF